MMSAFYLAMPLGAALGIMLGPIIANAYGWHRAFFIVGVPGFGRGLPSSFFLPEPVRGASEPVDPSRLRRTSRPGPPARTTSI